MTYFQGFDCFLYLDQRRAVGDVVTPLVHRLLHGQVKLSAEDVWIESLVFPKQNFCPTLADVILVPKKPAALESALSCKLIISGNNLGTFLSFVSQPQILAPTLMLQTRVQMWGELSHNQKICVFHRVGGTLGTNPHILHTLISGG